MWMIVKAETYYRFEVDSKGYEDYFTERKLRRATTLEKVGGFMIALGVLSFFINLSRVLIPVLSQVNSAYTLIGLGVVVTIAGIAIYSTAVEKAREARSDS